MNTKGSLYAIIGGVVGAVLTLAVCSVMPIGAQSGDATFGEITCTGLRVVDAVGRAKTRLYYDKDGGRIVVYTNKDRVVGASMGIRNQGRGGVIAVSSDERPIAAMIYVDDNGGVVSVAPGVEEHGIALMSVDKNGGLVQVKGKGKSSALMGVSKNGGGLVQVKGKAAGAQVDINEYGGVVAVYGNGSDKARVQMSVNEYGNGVANAWDKNNYRVGTLK